MITTDDHGNQYNYYELPFHIFCYRWGRGHPEEYTEAIQLGEEHKFDPDADKKPRAGQILWIRGLTRLQTQVSQPVVDPHLQLCYEVKRRESTLVDVV
jgi:Plasma membrane calcium transporter ATPase C terminal.